MRPVGFDHCVIAVSDWERSDAFYAGVLGAEIPPHDELWAEYRFGEWKLNVHGPGFQGLNARLPVEPGNSDLCFVWPGAVDEAIEHLKRHGVEIEAGPFDRDAARHRDARLLPRSGRQLARVRDVQTQLTQGPRF